ncbi:MAG: hypothetical protein ACT4QE_02390 [Anaerolineales bacterium]
MKGKAVYWLSILFAILGSASYHVLAKLIPSQANPLLSVVVTYAASIVLAVVLIPVVFPLNDGLMPALRQLNWVSLALALSIIAIEAGIILMYRSGWNLSRGSLIISLVVAVALIPIGLSLFQERLSLMNVAGIVVCIAGLVMVNWK